MRLLPKKPKPSFEQVLASQGKQLTLAGKEFFSAGDKSGLRTIFAQAVLMGAFGELTTKQGKEQVARLIEPLGGAPVPTNVSINQDAQRAGEAVRRRRNRRLGRAGTILTEVAGASLSGKKTILG